MFRFLERTIALHFLGLNVKHWFSVHSSRISISFCKWLKSASDERGIYIKISSAYKTSFVDGSKGRLHTPFMYTRNNKGPSTDPCGTPDSACVLSDETPSNTTDCFLSVKYDTIHLSKYSLSPESWSFLISKRCGTESKALVISKNTAPVVDEPPE